MAVVSALIDRWERVDSEATRRMAAAKGKLKMQAAEIETKAMGVRLDPAKMEIYTRFTTELIDLLANAVVKGVAELKKNLEVELDYLVKLPLVSRNLASMAVEPPVKRIPTIKTTEIIRQALDKVIAGIRAEVEKQVKPSPESKKALDSHLKRILTALNAEVITKLSSRQNYLEPAASALHHCYLVLMAYKVNRPIFAASPDLMDLIKNNHVVCLDTTTGTGKSTVLPALLLTAGFKRICVTQPRRLPCTLIAHHVADVFGGAVSGWEVSGAMEDPHNPVIYLTDGLLKVRQVTLISLLDFVSSYLSQERLLFDPEMKRYDYDVIVYGFSLHHHRCTLLLFSSSL